MLDLPDNIKKTIEALKKSHKHHIEVKISNQRCYIYESTSVWDHDRKKVKKISKYLGRIGGDGVFVGGSHRVPKLENYNEKENAEDVVSSYSTNVESQIIKALSMNGRISNANLGKIIGKSTSRTEMYRRNIEKKYGIKYNGIIYPSILGYTRYIALITFLNKKPTMNELNSAFSNESLIQVGLLCTGKYYIILFLLAKNNVELNDLISKLKIHTEFKKYDSEWYIAPRYADYGSIPVRTAFIESLQNQIWKRTKINPKPAPNQLTYREYLVTKEIHLNGNVDFSEIDRKYGFDKGASRYVYQKLIKKGVVHQISISMDKPGIKYSTIFILTILNGEEFGKSRIDILEETIKDLKHVNKYSYVCYIDNPYGIMFIMSVNEEKELKQTEEKLLKIHGIKLEMLVITNIFIGSLCYRKYDNNYSNQKKILIKEYGFQPTLKTIY